jgi:hypothetical protein
MKIRNVLSSLLLGAVISMPVYVHAESNDDAILKVLTDFADTPAQHESLAKYYKEQSDTAKKNLALHKQMKARYVSYSKMQMRPSSMTTHCDELIKLDEAAIKEYDALAAEHQAVIKK